MESRAQNAHLLPFFYYDTIKLTKKRLFLPVLYKVNGAMFEKSMPRNCNAFGCHVVIIDFR